MPLETPEMAGNRAPYPKGASFAALLDWHLDFGTRPGGSPDRPGKRWGNKEFAGKVGDLTDKTVRNWRAGRNPPTDLGSIERALFGESGAFNEWRFDLRAAYDGRRGGGTPGLPIPRPTSHFLGRDKDVTALLDALLGAPAGVAILVQGGPGIGKTTLTRAVGNHPDVVARFGEAARWFVALETATGAAAMQDAVIRAVGGDPAAGFAAALAGLRRQPGLLVLDNLETPWDAIAERRAVEGVLADLAGVPGLAVVASFRGRDRVGGPAWALVHPVHHLVPPYDTELFCRIAQSRFPGDPLLPRFIAALGGVPLAIELVAARAHGRASLADLWAQWTRIGAELATHPDFAADRLTSLPHSIELSLASDRMTTAARRLFRLLGVLPAGVAAEDRDALVGGDGFSGEEALLRIGLAVERGERLDLLPPIRDHAARRHRPDAADEDSWRAYYLALTQRLGEAIGTKAGYGAVARLVHEFANVEAAMLAALDAKRRQEAMIALNGFTRVAFMAALPSSALARLAAACRADDDAQGEANCIFGVGDIALARSDHAAARAAYEQALPLYRRVGDVLGEANCIKGLGDIALMRSDHAAARTAYEQALPLYRQVGSLQGEANCICSLGDIALRRSDHAAARAAYEQALPLYRQVGDVQGEANCIWSLGDIALRRSDHVAARTAYEQALPLYRQVGDVLGGANCIWSLGHIALALSDDAAARAAYEAALPLYRQVGSVLGEANCIAGVGDIALARSDHAAARAAYEEALPLYRQVGDVLGEANCVDKLKELDYPDRKHGE